MCILSYSIAICPHLSLSLSLSLFLFLSLSLSRYYTTHRSALSLSTVYTVTQNVACAQSARNLSEEWKELDSYENALLHAGFLSVQLLLASRMPVGVDEADAGSGEEGEDDEDKSGGYHFVSFRGRHSHPISSNYLRDLQVRRREKRGPDT